MPSSLGCGGQCEHALAVHGLSGDWVRTPEQDKRVRHLKDGCRPGFLDSCRPALWAWVGHRRGRHRKLAAELDEEHVAIQSLEALLATAERHISDAGGKQTRRLLMRAAQNSTDSCSDVADAELLVGSGGKVASCVSAKQKGFCAVAEIKRACRQSCGGCDPPATNFPAWGADCC